MPKVKFNVNFFVVNFLQQPLQNAAVMDQAAPVVGNYVAASPPIGNGGGVVAQAAPLGNDVAAAAPNGNGGVAAQAPVGNAGVAAPAVNNDPEPEGPPARRFSQRQADKRQKIADAATRARALCPKDLRVVLEDVILFPPVFVPQLAGPNAPAGQVEDQDQVMEDINVRYIFFKLIFLY